MSSIAHLLLLLAAVGVGIQETALQPQVIKRNPVRVELRTTPPVRLTARTLPGHLPAIEAPGKFTFTAPPRAAQPPQIEVTAELTDLHVQPEYVIPTSPHPLITVARPSTVSSFVSASQNVTLPPEVHGCRSCNHVGFLSPTVAVETSRAKSHPLERFGAVQSSLEVSAEPPAKQPRTEPVVIEFKPRPEYTIDARNNKIEGDLILQVLFKAVGIVEPVQVMHGLGFGLDESAWRAASEIRFLPAKRDGQAVDQLATVHFIFKLAY